MEVASWERRRPMVSVLDIASKTRRVEVDNRLSLNFYYRTAFNLLRQASIYRNEHNVIDLYILLLRYSSLVTDTIPDHKDYRRFAQKERAENNKKLLVVVGELEYLKPEVQRQVDRLNHAHQLPALLGNDASQWPAGPRRPEWSGQTQLRRIETRDFHGAAVRGGPYWNPPSSSRSIENQFGNMSLNIPRARDETLSRHSFLSSTPPPRRQAPIAPVRAKYPNHIDASPIEMPSLAQDWRGPSRRYDAPQRIELPNSVDVPAERLTWPEPRTSFPDGYAPVIGPDLAPVPTYTRQPDPPPIPVPVHPLPAAVHAFESPNVHAHESSNQNHTHLPAERVGEPRPGSPQWSGDDPNEEKGTKHLHISTRMLAEFLALASVNTQKNLETCAVLAGLLKKGVFYVSALIIPKQEATSDSCSTVNEEEVFDAQDRRGLFQLGWIHTHPTQTCFMSSIDVHTHYSYQIMLQEAIAIVMAPTDTERKYGIFRLSDPGGVKSIQQCEKRGFHPHEELPDGSPLYEHCGHVFMSPKLKFEVIDLRQS